MVDLKMSKEIELQRKLDALCNEFEDNWSANDPPFFTDYLNRIDGQYRDKLLVMLLEIDIDLRIAKGLSIDPQIYSQFGKTAVNHAISLLSRTDETETSDLSNNQLSISDLETPKQIGPYKLQQQIGEGGMGSVWMAEQEKPVRRRVALKLIRADMGSKEVVARFEAERQALAMMNHQNIAKILDAGTSEQGNPYFVMELVKGVPITKYCDENRLSVTERLRLFMDVCAGVQHAHQKGIIHRDLKPGNILVAVEDGKPVAKVIDFGLAKAMESTHRLTDQSLFTGIGQVLGTLKYMSPEQASMDNQDIDTRTDIYALGVILYELLTGSTPLDDSSIKGEAILKVLEIIREKDPVRPSSKLGSSTDEQISTIVGHRRIDHAKLNRVLAGDLDWIVMKALEKDRTRRYESASGFAADIERYLTNEPVQARPPSTAYKLRKYIRRNKGLVASLATITVVMLVAIVLVSWGFYSERIARADAQTTAKRTRDILMLVVDSFVDVNPEHGGTAEMPAKQVLINTYERMKQSDLDDIGRLELLNTLTDCFNELGEYEHSVLTSTEAIEISTRLHGAESEETLIEKVNLGLALRYSGQIKKAIEEYESSLDSMKSELGVDHEYTLTTMQNLARAYEIDGRYQPAHDMALEAHNCAIKALGPDDPKTLDGKNIYIGTLMSLGEIQQAIPLYEELIEQRSEVLGSDHTDTLTAMNNLAIAYSQDAQLSRAIDLFTKVLVNQQRKLGVDHPDTLMTQNNLAAMQLATGQFKSALKEFRELLVAKRNKLTDRHRQTIITMTYLGRALAHLGRLEESIEQLELANSLSVEVIGPDNPETMFVQSQLGDVYRRDGQFNKAIELIKPTIDSLRNSIGENNQLFLGTLEILGHAQLEGEQLEQAAQTLEKGRALFLANAPGSWRLPVVESMLGYALFKKGENENCEELLNSSAKRLMQMRDRVPRQFHEKIVESIERTIAFYEQTSAENTNEDLESKLEHWKAQLEIVNNSIKEQDKQD